MDRNISTATIRARLQPSLSARRAWIEMPLSCPPFILRPGSLSARRAWIEMFVNLRVVDGSKVALRKESVDRNALIHSKHS